MLGHLENSVLYTGAAINKDGDVPRYTGQPALSQDYADRPRMLPILKTWSVSSEADSFTALWHLWHSRPILVPMLVASHS